MVTRPDMVNTARYVNTACDGHRPLWSRCDRVLTFLVVLMAEGLRVCTFIANSCGALLAAISIEGQGSLAAYVAITVAVSSALSSIAEYHNLQSQVCACASLPHATKTHILLAIARRSWLDPSWDPQPLPCSCHPIASLSAFAP